MEEAEKKVGLDSRSIMKLLARSGSPIISLTELIKNSIDAASMETIITIPEKNGDPIIIQDYGDGFSKKELENLAFPGHSRKIEDNFSGCNRHGIPLAGSKGIGILSSFEICTHLKITSISRDSQDKRLHKFVLEMEKEEGRINGPTEVNVDQQEKTGTILELTGVINGFAASLLSENGLSKLMHFSLYPFDPETKPEKLPKITLNINSSSHELIPEGIPFSSAQSLYDFNFSFLHSDPECGGKPSIVYWFDKCFSAPDFGKHKLSVFSFDGFKKFLKNEFGIEKPKKPIEFRKIKNNDMTSEFSEIPDFGGRIIVYHDKYAPVPKEIKDFGYGVGEYVNGYILYSALDQNMDWLSINPLIQGVKYAVLFPHNLYGYLNIPNFKETEMKFEISSERDRFRELPAYTLMLSLIRGFIVGALFDIDVYEMQKRNAAETNTNGEQPEENGGEPPINGESVPSDSSEGAQKTPSESQEEKPTIPEKIAFPPLQGNKEDYLAVYGDDEGNSLLNGLKSEIDKKTPNSRECEKVYTLLYEISRLKFKEYPCSCVLLMRSLIDISAGLLAKKCGLRSQEDFYKSRNTKKLISYITYVLDQIISVLNKSDSETGKKLMPIFSLYHVELETIIEASNELFVHGKDVPDSATVFGSWKKVRSFISLCANPESQSIPCPLRAKSSCK